MANALLLFAFVTFLLCAAALPALEPAVTSAGTALPTATSHAELHALARAAGKLYFGTATDNPELTDQPYVHILSDGHMFGQLTPANSMKWENSEPEPGVFNFTGGQQIVSLAERNGQLMRGHNCVWHNQLPDWVANGTFTAAELTGIVQNHCSTLVGHWRGRIYAWDVINEPFNDDGTFGSDIFFDTLGTTYIPIALEAARRADPGAKLYINDFNIEGSGVKATAMQDLIRSLKAAGTPIDGVGLQCHFIVGEVPTTLEENMRAFVALGIEIAVTELDVRMTLPETPTLLEQQKADYTSVISACNSVERCIGVTVWDWTDKFSWVPGAFPNQGAACPWDENLIRKPAFDGIVSGFR